MDAPEPTEVKIDAVDEKILEELSRDARQSFRQLAIKVGSSPATVIQRVKRMEGEGLIVGYSPVIDYEKLGKDFEAFIEVTITKGALLEVQKKIAALPGVVSVYDVTGGSDSFVMARCKSRTEFSNLVKRILAIPEVERTNTHVILNVIKEYYRLVLEEGKKARAAPAR
jgi:DNA-binding Lrp family transcriptional regulator